MTGQHNVTRQETPITNRPADNWSPADNPHAIAVSEAQWWQRTVRLAVLRLRDRDDPRISWFSSRQIDARQLVFALRQLLTAERLEQVALKALGIDPAVRDALTQARKRFEDALPGIKHMRDGLMHFDQWSQGEGLGPQEKSRKAGELARDVARMYWKFSYEPNEGMVSFGPYAINVDIADRVAIELSQTIYLTAREVDKKNVVDLRAKIVDALTDAGINCDQTGALLNVSRGIDLKIWLSLNMHARADEQQRRELSTQVVVAFADAGLRIVCPAQPRSKDSAERLMRGEALYGELVTLTTDEALT